MKKLLEFCKDIYDPGVHLYFALNWYVALHAALSFNHGKSLSFSYDGVVAIITLFLVLFYLRIIDEIKDADYDKEFNKDRPLIKGSITLKDLVRYLVITAAVVPLLNFVYGKWVLLVLLADFIWSTFLIGLEKKSTLVRDNIFINLIVTYPVNVLLSFYILYLDLYKWNEGVLPSDLYVILAFACAFLYYEFARKISWSHQEIKGQRTYSSFFGTVPSVMIASGLAITSAVIMSSVQDTWYPALLVLPLAWGIFLLNKSKSKSKGFAMKLSGPAFIGLFYGVVIAKGILLLF